MASAPAPYMPDFGYKPQRYAVHNSSPDPIELRWAGLCFMVPAKDAFSNNPAVFDDGAPIPGTMSLADSYTFNGDGSIPENGSTPNWFAADAIRNMLGIDKQGIATSSYSRRGLSVLPDRPSREQVAEILEAGEARYHQFLIDWAQYTVMAYQEQAERSRRAGVAALPPGRDYSKAVIVIEKHNEEMKKHLGYVAATPAVVERDEQETLREEAYLLAEAMRRVKDIAEESNVDQVVLAKKLIENPKIRRALQKDFRIRSVGHLDVPEDPEAEA